eukprot:751875-Hanusia_phi.AAC.2
MMKEIHWKSEEVAVRSPSHPSSSATTRGGDESCHVEISSLTLLGILESSVAMKTVFAPYPDVRR